MKVLILGGTRFIGKAIAAAAAAAGHEVRLFNRGTSDPESRFETIQGDLADLPAHRLAFAAYAPDVVVHCLALTPADGTLAVKAFAGLDCQLMVLGSADCYEAFQQLNRGREVSDFPVSEDDSLSSIQYYYRELGRKDSDYDKNLMTDVLMAAGRRGELRPSVYRLPMVWGPGDYQIAMRHGGIIRRMHDRQRQFVLGAARQQTIWPFGYVGNLAAAIVHGFGKRQLDLGVFNLAEPRVRSWRRWIDLFADVAGFDFEVEILPDEWLDPDYVRNAPPQHMLLDSSRFRSLTGFSDPIALPAAIEATLEWGLAHPDLLGPAPDYTAEAEALNTYRSVLTAQRKATNDP